MSIDSSHKILKRQLMKLILISLAIVYSAIYSFNIFICFIEISEKSFSAIPQIGIYVRVQRKERFRFIFILCISSIKKK